MFHSSNLSGTENGPGADRVGQLLTRVGRPTSPRNRASSANVFGTGTRLPSGILRGRYAGCASLQEPWQLDVQSAFLDAMVCSSGARCDEQTLVEDWRNHHELGCDHVRLYPMQELEQVHVGKL